MWSVITIAGKYRLQLLGMAVGALVMGVLWFILTNALQNSYNEGFAEGKRRKQEELTLFWNRQVEQCEDKLRSLNLSAAHASEEARTGIAELNDQSDELK